jgi:hypothetical protein
MKKSPDEKALEQMLKASKISGCGFLGYEKRTLWEIIDADAALLEQLGKTKEQIADRMKQLSDIARTGLGDWIEVSDKLKVMMNDTRGYIVCPWPHHVRCLKVVTTVQRVDLNASITWSDLNIHLIRDHCFFEGKGSPFRLEPKALVEIIF